MNDEVVHGIPSSRRLEEGDVVSVDCGVVKNGFYGDSAYTFAVGEISDEVKKLLQVTKDSLYKGIEQAVAGMRIEILVMPYSRMPRRTDFLLSES